MEVALVREEPTLVCSNEAALTEEPTLVWFVGASLVYEPTPVGLERTYLSPSDGKKLLQERATYMATLPSSSGIQFQL